MHVWITWERDFAYTRILRDIFHFHTQNFEPKTSEMSNQELARKENLCDEQGKNIRCEGYINMHTYQHTGVSTPAHSFINIHTHTQVQDPPDHTHSGRQFPARERLARAITDSALAQLGVTLPVDSAALSHFESACTVVGREFRERPLRLQNVVRYGKKNAKKRILELHHNGVVDRDAVSGSYERPAMHLLGNINQACCLCLLSS
jgi:hypothetical protein